MPFCLGLTEGTLPSCAVKKRYVSHVQVVGSRLKGQPANIWKETLGQLEAAGVLCADGSNLFKQLKIGYGGLDDEEQREMFLDVACLFLGSKLDFAKQMWQR